MQELRQEGFTARVKFSFSTSTEGRTDQFCSAVSEQGALGDVELGLLSGLTQFHQLTWALLPQGPWLELHCYAFSHSMSGRVQRI